MMKTKNSNYNEPPDHRMPFLEHLEELRTRLIRSIFAVLVGFVACIYFSEKIFYILMIPILKALPESSKSLHFTGLVEPFMINIKVALLSGLFLTCPYIFYQLWLFISPGLYKHEKKYIIPFILFSSLFFVCGAMFGYFVVFPAGFKFFLSYSSDFLKPILTMKEYLSISIDLILVFGLTFEAPIIIFFLVLTGLVTPKQLLAQWRYVIVGASILSAVLTPADALTMIMMDIPLLLLYFLTVLFTFIFFKNKKKREANVQTNT